MPEATQQPRLHPAPQIQARGSRAHRLWARPPVFRPCSFVIPQQGLRRLLSTQHLGFLIHRVLRAGASPLLVMVEMKRFALPSESTCDAQEAVGVSCCKA